MSHSKPAKSPAIRFLFENSLFLIAGALAALIWANVDHVSYHNFIHFDLAKMFVDAPADGAHDEHHDEHNHASHDEEASPVDDHGHGEASAVAVPLLGKTPITIHFLINDVLMALFFAIAAKEVWESMLPGGALSNPRRAATPLLATLGGVLGPAGIYLSGAYLLGDWEELSRGWAIPCATDIAFSYLVARVVFGVGHPAIAFLLLLAIADDALGLMILAVAYPSKPIVPGWLGLMVAAVAFGFVLRKLKLQSFWWYLLIPGTLCWYAFFKAGLHPALGLVPIIPTMPNAHTDLGIFAREELNRDDTLNAFEHWWKNPVELILGLFGLANAGVGFNETGNGTYLVLIGLLLGKPLGITLFTWISEKVFKLEVPAGMGYRHIITLGMIAAIGFTVALFVSTAAFPAGKIQDSVKMGALMSLLAAVLSFVVARLLGVKPGPVAKAS
ncbi:MAG: Na+/H+ antiporter NhaA [Planctomycetales bacterium]|nr:Na+/H+ antiporter NhaA [Planctomycetales bacterium]